jgi:hypothetical protein
VLIFFNLQFGFYKFANGFSLRDIAHEGVAIPEFGDG